MKSRLIPEVETIVSEYLSPADYLLLIKLMPYKYNVQKYQKFIASLYQQQLETQLESINQELDWLNRKYINPKNSIDTYYWLGQKIIVLRKYIQKITSVFSELQIFKVQKITFTGRASYQIQIEWVDYPRFLKSKLTGSLKLYNGRLATVTESGHLYCDPTPLYQLLEYVLKLFEWMDSELIDF